MWCRAGVDAPPEVPEPGAKVWTANKPAESNGLVILGTPIGTPELVQADTMFEQIQGLQICRAAGCCYRNVQCLALTTLSASCVLRFPKNNSEHKKWLPFSVSDM